MRLLRNCPLSCVTHQMAAQCGTAGIRQAARNCSRCCCLHPTTRPDRSLRLLQLFNSGISQPAWYQPAARLGRHQHRLSSIELWASRRLLRLLSLLAHAHLHYQRVARICCASALCLPLAQLWLLLRRWLCSCSCSAQLLQAVRPRHCPALPGPQKPALHWLCASWCALSQVVQMLRCSVGQSWGL